MFGGVQIPVEPFIGHHKIVVVLEIEFVLNVLMQSVSDCFSDEIFGHKFLRLSQSASREIFLRMLGGWRYLLYSKKVIILSVYSIIYYLYSLWT